MSLESSHISVQSPVQIPAFTPTRSKEKGSCSSRSLPIRILFYCSSKVCFLPPCFKVLLLRNKLFANGGKPGEAGNILQQPTTHFLGTSSHPPLWARSQCNFFSWFTNRKSLHLTFHRLYEKSMQIFHSGTR